MNDVDNFVNYINNINGANNKKRGRDQINSDDLIIDIKLSVIDRFKKASNMFLNYKGRQLSKYLNGLKKTLALFINEIKNDNDNQIPELIKLCLIAEVSVSIGLFDEINKLVSKNKNQTYDYLLNKISNELKQKRKQTFVSNKKIKTNNLPILLALNDNNSDDNNDDSDDDSDYEDDSDDYTSNDDDNNSSDDDSDDEFNISSSILSKKDGLEFINQIFKSKNQDDENIILKYFSKLSKNDKTKALNNLKAINEYQANDKPILFKIIDMPLPISQKNHILKNYTELATSRHSENKLRNWFDSLMTIPFGEYKGINLKDMKTPKVKKFLNNLQKSMDDAVYGHDEAKRQIIQIMGQQIRNPQAKGCMLGIFGCPGNGKSTIVKEGIAKAMDKPLVFISLGGATDSSFLEGHSYTYEGSIYGRIVNGLITSKCMDPIFYFDELDKISKSHKGEEITNLLVHLTDPVQNSHFRDKYFHGIDIDLSRATMIFSFNDPSNVNPILMDRITTIETKYLMVSQKIHIANNYLLPEIIKDMGLKPNDININDDTIRYIINTYTDEGGVRKLKSILYNICRELNIANLTKDTILNSKITFPFSVKIEYLKTLLKHKMEITHDKIHSDDKTGIVNGLWANSLGQGGILSIETMMIPSESPLKIKATGHLEQVIKESTEVATSLAWNYLPIELKNNLLTEWKDKPMGIHIHCPDGATPKDGPSAGAALTIALYSLLTGKKIKHDIAMTGEINLEGKVTAIGGLEEKLEGAKRAGVKLVLFPKENIKHIDKIKERNTSLINDDFKVIPIETFDDVMIHALV